MNKFKTFFKQRNLVWIVMVAVVGFIVLTLSGGGDWVMTQYEKITS